MFKTLSIEFVDAFMYSYRGQELIDAILRPLEEDVSKIQSSLPEFANRYQNSDWKSLMYVIQRECIMIWRSRHVMLKERIIQNSIMAILVSVFFFNTGGEDKAESLFGVYFHSVRFVALNSAREVIPQLDLGPIIQKQHHSNFVPMYTYILGRSFSLLPLFIIDCIVYGVPVYFACGLGDGAENRPINLLNFLVLLLMSGYTVYIYLGIFSAGIRNDKSLIIAVMAVQFFIMVITSGFTIQYDVLNSPATVLYWCNYMAWCLRAIIVNEFRSGAYNETDYTNIMTRFGYVWEKDDKPFGKEWIYFALLFCIGKIILSIIITSYIWCRNAKDSVVLNTTNTEFLFLSDDDFYGELMIVFFSDENFNPYIAPFP